MTSHLARVPGPALDTSVPVLVLRRSIMPLQHGVLAVARSLGRLGVPVHVVADRGREPSTNSRYVAGRLPLSADWPEPEWIDALEALGSRFSGAILLPIDDLAATLVGDHQTRLAQTFRLPAAPPGIHRRLASKRELWRLCQQFGLPTPLSSFPADRDELTAQAEHHGYPVVLKRAEPWYAPRDPAAPSVAIVGDRRDLLEAYARMESDVQPQVMVQQYIPGGTETVWMFNGYVGAESQCLCSFTGRKLRQCGAGPGPTTLGVCETNSEVAEIARRLLQALDYRGIVDMGMRFDARDGSYRLLDVNPRLGSTFRLFAAPEGLDVARALHLDLTGRIVPTSTTPGGRRWIDEPNDLVTSIRMARRGALGARDWGRSLHGVQEGAWWASDDPRPMLGMSVSLAHRFGRRLFARAQPSPAATPAPDAPQQAVDRYFDTAADYWSRVYGGHELPGLVYRERMRLVSRWARQCDLPAGVEALDVGCGAGLMSVELAEAGFSVTATDSSPAMVRSAAALVEHRGLTERIAIHRADARRLPFLDGQFDLIVALGLLPWLQDPETVVTELVRVLAPGGCMILTADNRHRLNRVVDPRESPLAAFLRPAKRALLPARNGRDPGVVSYRHSPREVDEMLRRAGLQVVRHATVGYGPFTIMSRQVLPDPVGVSLHVRLQRAAGRHPALRTTGWHYVVACLQGSVSDAQAAEREVEPAALSA
jgi:D-aspartate ligase